MTTYDQWLATEPDDQAPAYCEPHGWEGDPELGCPACHMENEAESLATDDGVYAGRVQHDY